MIREPFRLALTAALIVAPLALADSRSPGLETCAELPAIRRAAPETEVRIATPAGSIAGTQAGPLDGAPLTRALLLHGYTGSRDEIAVAGGEGMFARTARAFAERGIATLRIDFLGSGESDGVWADTTFAGQARDALRALEALEEKVPEDAIPTGVLGYSQGGLVALRAASSGGSFDRIALWNPVLDPAATYGLILGAGTLAEGAALYGEGDRKTLVGTSGLRPGFFAGLATADPLSDAMAMGSDILIVTGREDALVRDGAALGRRLAAARSAPTTILDLDAGHDLGAVSDPALLDRVIACTAGFLLQGGDLRGR